MPHNELPSEVDVCILGAGPHGLAAALHLLRADPTLAERLVVLDPAGAWLAVWRDHFARLEIEHLRSPIVHHPAPEVTALALHVARHGLAGTGLPYEQPTAEAFESFCDELVDLAGLAPPLALRPRRIRAVGKRLLIEAGDQILDAAQLVVATNPHRRQVPGWVEPLLGRFRHVQHSDDVDLRDLDALTGERVSIVGGGLTAAHLACGAARRGAEVHLLARRELTCRNFDTDPGWLGPRYLRGYDDLADPRRKLAVAQAARGGGSIPPWMHDQLVELASDRRVTLHEAAEVAVASDDGMERACLRLDDGTDLEVDRLWLATGTAPDLTGLRCAHDLVADMGLVDGLPATDDDLRAGSHPVYVMGRLATLTLGPAAGNLWGAQRAARRIAGAITGVDLEPGTTAHLPPPPPTRRISSE